MLLTVATTWNVSTDKIDKEGCLTMATKHVTAEAAKEVRESPSTKEQALTIMREWIQQNIDIKNVRQGTYWICSPANTCTNLLLINPLLCEIDFDFKRN